jgi:hypothetical protein
MVDKSVEAKMVITQIDLGGTGCFANFQLNAQIAENAHFTIHKIQMAAHLEICCQPIN